ncbi:MAG: ammonium transporter [Actinomycetota bacterium]
MEDSGSIAWLIMATALVLFMTPGLALFYGGLVRSKNVLSTFMHSVVCMGVISIVWLAAGYALAFGPDKGGFIGGGDFYFFNNVAGGDLLFATFQMTFAIITPALISGAFAERAKFRGVVVFFVLWSLLVYSPVAHWVWHGDGWLFTKGVLDFAGGTVVHINAGIAALVFAIYLKPRKGFPRDGAPPHDIPMTVLGAGILWFGWFGFNAGSALAADGVAINALATTHFGAAAGLCGWLLIERLRAGKATAVGAATGAVGGLVAVTPAAGFVEPWAAAVIGFVAALVCYLAVGLKTRLRYDDSLDVVGVHLVGGLIGAMLTGVFATTAVNPAGDDGWLFGNFSQFVDQGVGVLATMAFSAVVSFVLIVLVDKTVGLRVSEEEEMTGCDLTQHGETAYVTSDAGSMRAG